MWPCASVLTSMGSHTGKKRSVNKNGTLTELLQLRSPGDTDITGIDGIDFILSVCFPWYKSINFCEAVKVNSAVIHLMGFLVLLATVQPWSLLYQNPRLRVIDRTLSKAWDEVVGFLLVILILLTGSAIAFNLLFGWSISDYRTFLSSAITVVSLLMGISHHKEVTAVNPVLGSFLIFTYVVLMVLMIINLFVSAILMAFGKERKSLKQAEREATLMDMLLLKLSSLLGIQQHQRTCKQTALTATAMDK